MGRKKVAAFCSWYEEFLVSRGIILYIQQHGQVPKRKSEHTCKCNFWKTWVLVVENSAMVGVHGMWQKSWVALEGKPGRFLISSWFYSRKRLSVTLVSFISHDVLIRKCSLWTGIRLLLEVCICISKIWREKVQSLELDRPEFKYYAKIY